MADGEQTQQRGDESLLSVQLAVWIYQRRRSGKTFNVWKCAKTLRESVGRQPLGPLAAPNDPGSVGTVAVSQGGRAEPGCLQGGGENMC